MINDRKILNIVYLLLVALFFSLCLSFFAPLSIPRADTHPTLSGGVGSKEDPYLISNRSDLLSLSQYVYSGGKTKNIHYKITNSIDMENTNFTPIGTMVGTTIYYFDGYFDGNNSLIYNLKIENGTNANGDLGLFGYIRDPNDNGSFNTEIKNVRLHSGTINLTASSKSAGGVVGSAYKNAEIKNCSNIGVSVTCPAGNYGNTYIGGILGASHSNDVIVTSSYNSANHSNSTYGVAKTGGIAGEIYGTITECFNIGEITSGVVSSETSFGGGICGIGYYIYDCYNKGKVTGSAVLQVNILTKDDYVSKVEIYSDIYIIELGMAYDWSLIHSRQGAYETEYSVEAYTGGIAGNVEFEISRCYNVGEITGGYRYKVRNTQFGILADNREFKITNVINLVFESDSYVGDIFGYSWENISLSQCYAKGTCISNNRELTSSASASGFTYNQNWNGTQGDKMKIEGDIDFEIRNLNAIFKVSCEIKTNKWNQGWWLFGWWDQGYEGEKTSNTSKTITTFSASEYRANDFCSTGNIYFSNDKWFVDESIDASGLPILKSIYWSGNPESF